MKKKLIGVVLVVVLILGLGFIYTKFSPKPIEGSKSITIEVVDDQKKSTTYDLKTDADYLKEAMDEVEGLTYSGEDTAYGYTLYTVNGVTADFNVDNAYWSIYVNNEYGQFSLDKQPINDKDAFKVEYTVYE